MSQTTFATIGAKLEKLVPRFNRARRSGIAVSMALGAVPLVLAAGVAIDMARASHEAQSFQSALDASVFAIAASTRSNVVGLTATQLTARKAELKALAQTYLDRNFEDRFSTEVPVTLSVDVNSDYVTLSGTYTFPTAMMRIVGIYNLSIKASAEVKKQVGVSEGVEIILVMDTTGSMAGTKITAAKDAAKNLIKEVLGASTSHPHIKFALVPFAAGVKVGTQYRGSGWIDVAGASSVSRLHFTDQTWHNMKAWDDLANVEWNGCVEARPGSYATDDTAPVAGDTLFPVYFAPDEPGSASSNTFPNSYLADGVSSTNNLTLQNNQTKYTNASISSTRLAAGKFPGFNCATAPIVPLTTSRAVVEAGIDAMTPSGSTVIPEGLAWGWRVGSASAPFTEGSGNADGFWRKVIVLMTDGENNVVTTDSNGNEKEVNATNGSFYSAFGYGKAATGNRFGTTDSYALDTSLNTKTQTLCTNIKAPTKTDPKDKVKTIPVYEIYTVVFDLNSTTVETLLRNCATDPEHYANASNSEQLKTIFAQIGERLKSMYLTK